VAKQLEVELGIIRVEVEQVIALAVATAGIILPSLKEACQCYMCPRGERVHCRHCEFLSC
jgi:hypothetical protein